MRFADVSRHYPYFVSNIAPFPPGSEYDFRNIEVWGTVISIQIPHGTISNQVFQAACAGALSFYQEIDNVFSTYKTDSQVSKLRNEEITIDEASPLVKIVWNKCLELRTLTQRAFDPWAVPGGLTLPVLLKDGRPKSHFNTLQKRA